MSRRSALWIALSAGWLAMGFWLYPVKGAEAPKRLSIDEYQLSRQTAAGRVGRVRGHHGPAKGSKRATANLSRPKLPPTLSVLPSPRPSEPLPIAKAPVSYDQNSVPNVVAEGFDALRWPKLSIAAPQPTHVPIGFAFLPLVFVAMCGGIVYLSNQPWAQKWRPIRPSTEHRKVVYIDFGDGRRRVA